MRKPTFFIIGAPKCGTTSLASWLAGHPTVYLTNPKEPDYFDTDRRKRVSLSLSEYEALYDGVTDRHAAIGEASVSYLRSSVAVANIIRYSERPKFIVGLRNPVDMAVSWHGQTIHEAWETEPDFQRAWELQISRREGRNVPAVCSDVRDLLYGDVCRLGAQVERVLEVIGDKTRVCFYTLDEMRDPGPLYRRILRFLDVPDDGRTVFPTKNTAKRAPRWVRLANRAVSDLKRLLAVEPYRLGLMDSLYNRLATERRTSLSGEVRMTLFEYFREDILLLSRLVERDLTAWSE